MVRVLVLAAACLAATAAVAAPGVNGETRRPDWLKKPDAREIRAGYPVAAMRKGVGGKAVVRCTASTAGTLSGCRVEQEDPAGLGFGQAALMLAPSYLVRPPLVDGRPVESEIAYQV